MTVFSLNYSDSEILEDRHTETPSTGCESGHSFSSVSRNFDMIMHESATEADISTELPAPVVEVEACSVFAVQESLQNEHIRATDYYDILILGRTGQGKTTTADKLLIANPTGVDYRPYKGWTTDSSQRQIAIEDLSAWIFSSGQSSLENLSTRMKCLVFYRSLENPHIEINEAHENNSMFINQSTASCELFSNETTRVRVLDVPGFFGVARDADQDSHIMLSAKESHHSIMRKILQIQVSMAMRFKRILYFLPCRDTLQISNAALQQELQLMCFYFGRSIFESMVLVATLGPTFYRIIPETSPVEIPNEAFEKSRAVFREALQSFLPESTPDPPIIFISLRESCESILRKVREAEVAKDNLQWEFELDSFVCAHCSITVGERNGERVACTSGDNWSEAILIEHSHCHHPHFIPKYTIWQKVQLTLLYAIKNALKYDQQHKWPDFSAKICPLCKQLPGIEGCEMLGSWCEGTVIQHVKATETHRLLLQRE